MTLGLRPSQAKSVAIRPGQAATIPLTGVAPAQAISINLGELMNLMITMMIVVMMMKMMSGMMAGT